MPRRPSRSTAADENMTQLHAPEESVEKLAESFVEEAEPEVDLSSHTIEDWVTFGTFWILCGVVFLQFFTRYALNNSAAWTEEAARYLLIFVVFLGSAMCVRLNRHIQVDLLYRYLPPAAGRVLATFVDLLRVSLTGYCVWLTWEVKERVGQQPMTMIDWPMAWVHWVVLIAFALMCFRAAVVAVGHLRTGTSILESPDHVVPEA
jgi:TRAP-type C4-dicarboxylate transport system permease small subunit